MKAQIITVGTCENVWEHFIDVQRRPTASKITVSFKVSFQLQLSVTSKTQTRILFFLSLVPSCLWPEGNDASFSNAWGICHICHVEFIHFVSIIAVLRLL